MFIAIHSVSDSFVDVYETKEKAILGVLLDVCAFDEIQDVIFDRAEVYDIEYFYSYPEDVIGEIADGFSAQEQLDMYSKTLKAAMELVEEGEFAKISNEGEGHFPEYEVYLQVIEAPENAQYYGALCYYDEDDHPGKNYIEVEFFNDKTSYNAFMDNRPTFDEELFGHGELKPYKPEEHKTFEEMIKHAKKVFKGED